MKKYMLALFIYIPICAGKHHTLPENQIRVSSICSYLKERIQRLSRHSNKLSHEECLVIDGAREWYQELQKHHRRARNNNKKATIPESVYVQIHKALQLLEENAHLRTPQEPVKKYVETGHHRQFKKMLSLNSLENSNYWKKVLELTGVGVVLLLIYKTFIRPNNSNIIVVNGESNESTEPQSTTPAALDTNIGG